MSRLPRITGRELVAALKRLGFVEARQSGSHLVLKRQHPPSRVVVPVHAGRVLKLGTLKAILDEGAVSEAELLGVVARCGLTSVLDEAHPSDHFGLLARFKLG